MYLLGREGEGEEEGEAEGERTHTQEFPSAGSIPKCLKSQMPGAGQGEGC